MRRLHAEEGLQLKSRGRPRRMVATVRITQSVATPRYQRWAMDLVQGVVAEERAIRLFTRIDVCARECIAQHAAPSLESAMSPSSRASLDSAAAAHCRRQCSA
ncbi:MAG: hypothetical protein Q8K82_22545 [Gemmatimonadaceae bacterium]|nr:hypothetical protein [Gemmatimonadaceae bacterium]